MASFKKLGNGEKLVGQSQIDLPNGNRLVTEVIQIDRDSFLIGHVTVAQKDGVVIRGTWCGECAGRSIGCVDCPNNDPVVNCVNGTISCGS
jgi:hypothetical protein